MGEFAPLKTGQLVIRFHAPWRRRTISIVCGLSAVVLIYGAYELGRFQSGYSVVAAFRDKQFMGTRIAELEKQNQTLHDRAAQAEMARSIDRRSYDEVAKSITQLNADLQHEREQVAFYKGIVSPSDGVRGLHIQGLDIDAGEEHHYKLRLVLMQAIRQDASIAGSVHIEIEGTRAQQATKLNLQDVSQMKSEELPFSFRYFQNLEQEIVLPPDFEPTAVHVEIKSPKSSPIEQTFPWQIQSAE
jgi:hypothetical protein